MADPNVKQVTLIPGAGATGTADVELEAAAIGGRRIVLDSEGGGSRRRGRGSGGKAKTYRIGTITKEGGGSTSPGTMTQLAASHIPGSVGAATAVGVNSDLTQKGAPVAAAAVGASTGGAGGGTIHAKPVKVVLAAPKKAKSKVILAAAAVKPAGSPAKPLAAMLATSKHGAKTHKASRKVRISMAGLSRKIHKAKTIRNKASSESLESIKKALHKAGLIKAESKAPDYILRQMYADFMTLKNRAL